MGYTKRNKFKEDDVKGDPIEKLLKQMNENHKDMKTELSAINTNISSMNIRLTALEEQSRTRSMDSKAERDEFKVKMREPNRNLKEKVKAEIRENNRTLKETITKNVIASLKPRIRYLEQYVREELEELP